MKLFKPLPQILSCVFEKIGRFVSCHPKKMIVFSLFSSIVIGLGALKLEILYDFDRLYFPKDSKIYQSEKIINRLFPTNTTKDFTRETRLGMFLQLIFIPTDEGSALRPYIFDEVVALHRKIMSFQIEWKGERYNYSQVCAKDNGSCYHNDLLNYIEQMRRMRETSFKYPVEFDMLSAQFNVTAIAFGGVKVGYTKEILDAKALRLLYILDKKNDDLAEKWESEFFERLSEQKLKGVRLIKFSTSYYGKEFWKMAKDGSVYGVIGNVLLILVCILSSMTSEWIPSKPLLGIAICSSAGLALMASFGVLALVKVPYSTINGAAIFFILGIAVDDMFVMIAAWRNTNPADNVANRMGKTYHDAATSVTLTSLTNLIVLIVGSTFPTRSISYFCYHCAVGVTFDFLYQLTFFGGCMALDGQREEKKLHPIFFKPVVSRESVGNRSWIYQILFTDKPGKASQPALMIWFRDYVGKWMKKKSAKILIFMAFFAYLAGASWGVTKVKRTRGLEEFYSHGSNAYHYMKEYYKYFGNFSSPVQVVIYEKLDYSNRTVQKDITRVINRIQQSKQISPIAANWLKNYLFFTRYYKKEVSRYNLTDPKQFNSCLRDVFFTHPMGKLYKRDVVFDEDGVHISASRFIVFTSGISGHLDELTIAENLQSVTDSFPYKTAVHCSWWFFLSSLVIDTKLLMIYFGATFAIIFTVILLFTHNIFTATSVTVLAVSVQLGLVGYLSICGTSLNTFSTLMLILSIGLGVDFSAHFMHAFNIAEGSTSERVQQTLYCSAMPIIQGGVTTFLVMAPLAVVNNHFFRVIVLTLGMETAFSIFHSIVVLPAVILVMPSRRKCKKEWNLNAGNTPTVAVISSTNTIPV